MRIRPRIEALTAGLPPAYWLLWVGTLVNRFGGLVIPFLALYLTSRRSVPVPQAALVVSLFGAGSFISQLIGGGISDRWGRRPIMLLSFLSAPVAMIGLGLARGLPAIAACTLLLGFCTDLYRPAVNAAVADLVSPQARTRGYGYIYWAINMGAAVAPIIAGFLAVHSYFLLFVADAATTLAYGLIVLFALPETRPIHPEQPAQSGGIRLTIARLSRAPVLLFLSFLTLLFGIIYTQGNVTLPLDMAAYGLRPADYGLAISVNGFVIILTTIPVSVLAAKWHRYRTLAIAGVFLGLGFGSTALAATLPLFMASVALWTIGEILGSAIAPAVVADLSPVELRGFFQGIFGASWGLSYFAGPWLGGVVYQAAGARMLWLGCLCVGVLLAGAYLLLGRAARRGSPRAPAASAGSR